MSGSEGQESPQGRELAEIRRRYAAGDLDGIRQDLERFLHTHREEILRFRNAREVVGVAPMTDELAVKLYIIKTRSINPQAEIQDQLREIEREKWIWGIHLGRPPDPNEVMREWAQKYSTGWRAYRLTSILYIFEQDRDRYLSLLAGDAGDVPPPESAQRP